MRQCDGCWSNRKQVVPEYPSCKLKRLCELVDPGILAHCHLQALREYAEAHKLLLKGANEFNRLEGVPLLPSHDFEKEVRSAHAELFQHLNDMRPGHFRRWFDEVSVGGRGQNRFDGWEADRIPEGVRQSGIRLMTGAAAPSVRVARFFEHFFRVHPFMDGNGRVARMMVQRALLNDGLHARWDDSAKARRRYVSSLEYAHRRRGYGDRALRFLVDWVERQLVAVDPPDEDESMSD